MIINNKKLQMASYKCQVGMYFSKIKKLNNGLVVFSDTVESADWNFFVGFRANSVKQFEKAFLNAKTEFQNINRKPCFVLSPLTKVSKKVENYINENYLIYTNVSFMLTKNFNITPNNDINISYRAINNLTESEMFVQVFKTSKTQTLPTDIYPKLEEYFFSALEKSFVNNKDKNLYGYKFINYISMYKEEPVGMATACVNKNIAGIYGGGTFVKYRGKGIFSGLLNFIQKDLNKQGVKYFFGFTESDSKNENYYNKIGWKTIFHKTFYISKYNK